jgi:hypothetical protein
MPTGENRVQFGPDQAVQFDDDVNRAIETLLTGELDVLSPMIDASVKYAASDDGEAVTVGHVVRALASDDRNFPVLTVGIVCALLANPTPLYGLIRDLRMKSLSLDEAVNRVKFLLDQTPHAVEHFRSSTQPPDRA